MSDMLYGLLSTIERVLVGESDGVGLCSHESNEGSEDGKGSGELHGKGSCGESEQ